MNLFQINKPQSFFEELLRPIYDVFDNRNCKIQECPPTIMRIILRFKTIKRNACQITLFHQKVVFFVGIGGYDSS